MEEKQLDDTFLNYQVYEEHQIFEIKMKLDEEVIKNETLERKLRDMEYEHMKNSNELARKIKEMEMKNGGLVGKLGCQNNEVVSTEKQMKAYETEFLSLKEKLIEVRWLSLFIVVYY